MSFRKAQYVQVFGRLANFSYFYNLIIPVVINVNLVGQQQMGFLPHIAENGKIKVG